MRYSFLSACCWIPSCQANLPRLLLIYYSDTQAFRKEVLHKTIDKSGYSHAPFFTCFLFVFFFCYFQEFGGRSLEVVDIIELKSHHQNVPFQLCSARYSFLSTCCWIAALRTNSPPILLIYYCGTRAFRNRVLHQTIEISGLSGYSHAPASRFSSGSQLLCDDE